MPTSIEYHDDLRRMPGSSGKPGRPMTPKQATLHNRALTALRSGAYGAQAKGLLIDWEIDDLLTTDAYRRAFAHEKSNWHNTPSDQRDSLATHRRIRAARPPRGTRTRPPAQPKAKPQPRATLQPAAKPQPRAKSRVFKRTAPPGQSATRKSLAAAGIASPPKKVRAKPRRAASRPTRPVACFDTGRGRGWRPALSQRGSCERLAHDRAVAALRRLKSEGTHCTKGRVCALAKSDPDGLQMSQTGRYQARYLEELTRDGNSPGNSPDNAPHTGGPNTQDRIMAAKKKTTRKKATKKKATGKKAPARKKATRKKVAKKKVTKKKATRKKVAKKKVTKKKATRKKATRRAPAKTPRKKAGKKVVRRSTRGKTTGKKVNLTALVKEADKSGLQVWACKGERRTGCGGGVKGRGGSRGLATLKGRSAYKPTARRRRAAR